MEFRELSVISRNSDQISWKLQRKINDLLRFQPKSPKMRNFHENFAKFCENLQNSRNPFCESCRSRKIWKNEYLVAIVAVDTAENGPPKVWPNWINYSVVSLAAGHSWLTVGEAHGAVVNTASCARDSRLLSHRYWRRSLAELTAW